MTTTQELYDRLCFLLHDEPIFVDESIGKDMILFEIGNGTVFHLTDLTEEFTFSSICGNSLGVSD